VLLPFHQLNHIFRDGWADDLAAFELFHHQHHLVRCRHTKPEFLVLRIFAGGAFAATADLPHDLDLLEAERLHTRVHRVCGEDVKDEICSGVITHEHHQVDRVAKSEP